MARNLYRLYLYIIFIALSLFAVGVTAQLLTTLFAFTPLRGSYAALPTQAALVQSLVFAIVGWLISGALGGLHYWLIRRDMKQDQAAGESAIRSFFLNMTEAGGILVVVPLIGFMALGNWAYNNGGDVSYAIGTALPTLLMVLLLELERRRTQVREGAALVFQRLHFFGVQLILLFFVASAFMTGFRPLIDILFFSRRGMCGNEYCQSYHFAGLALTLFWFVACWLIYSLLTSRDSSRLLRMIMHGASLAFGIGWTLYGAFVAFEVFLSPLFRISVGFKDVMGSFPSHDFVSPLALGIFSTAIYHLLLRDISRRDLIEHSTLLLSEGTIAALLAATAFWAGCGSLLYNLLQWLAPSPTVPENSAWLAALAVLVTGLVYVPLDLIIRRHFALHPDNAIGPRRSLVLALLGAGILAFAIGGVIALYAWGTALLGSPLNSWPQIAHSGLAATIVGAALIAIYVWPLRGEHLLARSSKTAQPPAPEVPPATTTIEDILDELLAGHITRPEAAARIRSLHGTATLLLV
ncbi:MAG TPA: hypothetical protein VN729_00255 [Ktedonobacteraceae bacterium]|nr:hypothetical protein [Ktedonobacteraceae bacterium]